MCAIPINMWVAAVPVIEGAMLKCTFLESNPQCQLCNCHLNFCLSIKACVEMLMTNTALQTCKSDNSSHG